MNWGVRIALLTSDHFGASGEVKVRFSAAPGLDPWHGLPGVMQRASRGCLRDLPHVKSEACRLLIASRQRRCDVRIRAGWTLRAAPGKLLQTAAHLG